MTKNQFEIREATIEDIDEIVALNYALFQEDAGQRDPFMNLNWPRENGQAHFSRHIAGEHSICFLAEIEGEVVGYLVGYLENKSELRPVQVAELESMFIQSEYRGLSVGTDLVNQFLKWALKEGAERISVTAYAANEKAIRFYKGLGFLPKSLSLERGIE